MMMFDVFPSLPDMLPLLNHLAGILKIFPTISKILFYDNWTNAQIHDLLLLWIYNGVLLSFAPHKLRLKF